jgi:hypothetical protein
MKDKGFLMGPVLFAVLAAGILAGCGGDGAGGGGGEYGIALAAFAKTGIRLPGSINHRLSLGADFSSGNWGGTFTAFAPLSGHSQGVLFTQKLSSLARLSLGYTARLMEALSLDLGEGRKNRPWAPDREDPGGDTPPCGGKGRFYREKPHGHRFGAGYGF